MTRMNVRYGAIDWKGEYGSKGSADDCPANEEFKEYYESTQNPQTSMGRPNDQVPNDVFIPVLDEAMTTMEIEQRIKQLKSGKACGPDGVSPGLYKLLPGSWILTLMTLFNAVFHSGVYPQSWAKAKLFTI